PATSAGTYTYTLREQAGDQPTLTYDQTEHTITVVVKDNNGQLEVESMTPAPTFTNTYRPLPTEYTIRATKQLTGRELVDGEFTFELVSKDNNQTKHTATNNAQGAITFAAIPATSAGTYTYTLREQAGDQPTLTYDQTEHTITVVVKDNNGQLGVESMTPAPTFTNTYRPLPTEYTIRAKSVLEGKQQKAGQFTFELWDDNDKKLGTTTNDASGDITFENVEINEVGNRVFTIKEIIQPSPTITHLTESEEVALSIEDKNGQLVATPAKDEVPVFYHRYKPLPAEHIVEAQVRVDGCMLAGEALTYELVDNTGSVVRTATSDKNIIRFEPIRFEEVTTKRYTLRQVAGSDSQVTYATNQPEITFTVVDNDGQLIVTQKNSEELSFVNVYQSKPIEQVIQAKVTFTGADAMSTFDFVMINEKSEVVATAQNNAEGNIVFNPIQFAKQGDYHFEIKQVIGDNNKIIYDRTTHAINVKVDEAACKLEVTLVPASPVIFENELVPTPPHSSDESTSSSSSESEPPHSSDESTSSSSSESEPPHSSDESTSSSSSESEPPHSSDESTNSSSSESEPPHSSDESTSSSSSESEPPHSSDESTSSSSSESEPPHSNDESTSSSSSESEPPHSNDESTSSSSSESEPPNSHKKLPKTGENPTVLLWMSITLIGMASIYAKVARKHN
ncbi:LPXTG cell wall anchor domain-containing protein, partial [Aerococcaceae bacterium NML201209]|nr:LPXTG cell wall anchor domain-containing protein [Aerococcaceae bacterium NML201209]